jgi:hypothetical protein
LAASLLSCALAALSLGACGSSSHGSTAATSVAVPHSSAPVAPPPPTPAGPAFGLTEDNANLLWSPAQPDPPGGAAFAPARGLLTALHPSYLRLLVDWAALQPTASSPPALAGAVSGCARQTGPCGAFAGLREALAAIASQQRAAAAAGQSGFQVVLDIFGTPAWAARPPSGCERPGTDSFSRPLSAAGIAGYRSLIGALLALGAEQAVALPWWSPWNEPNDPVFLSPQRASCNVSSPPVSAAAYAQLVRTMAAALQAAGGQHQLLLGELSAAQSDSPHRTSIASFLAALPEDVVCLSRTWSLHVYAAYGRSAPSGDPVAALEAALDAHGSCGRNAHVWITEAGAGAPRPGRPRESSSAQERQGCLALAEQLVRWVHDERIETVMQYSFREDPAFPVGLLSAELTHTYPAYQLWRRYTRMRARGQLPGSASALCA